MDFTPEIIASWSKWANTRNNCTRAPIFTKIGERSDHAVVGAQKKSGMVDLPHFGNIWPSCLPLSPKRAQKTNLTSSEPQERPGTAPMPGTWTGVAAGLGKNRETDRGWVWGSGILHFGGFSAPKSRNSGRFTYITPPDGPKPTPDGS